jgi:erythromycin esterase-like protein
VKARADLAFAAALRGIAQPLTGAAQDYDALLTRIGDARVVLLGEASHGTHEFYRERAQITKRLIVEKGFSVVAAEADWPHAYRVNRFVRGASDDAEASDALAGFERFPTWMWRNADVLDFVGWLRAHNASLPKHERRAGFYGLDLYSLRSSMDAVIGYLEGVDPKAAARASARYGCFDHFGPDTESYALAVGGGLFASCEDDVVAQLVELQRRRSEYARLDGVAAEDEFFYAEQNARVAKNAEHYYRTMIGADVSSWNLRDTHMTETLARLLAHLDLRRPGTKAVVWAHNSHVGDARATEMGRQGEVTIGQLARTLYPAQTVLVGFMTHSGSVTAASAWHGPAERKLVRPALAGSHEAALHLTGIPRLYVDCRALAPNVPAGDERLERAIGVVYRPETERQSHYFHARLTEQFDALLHFDRTRAVEPLERTPQWDSAEVPETFPTGV